MAFSKDIIDDIASNIWLYEKVFWKLLDKLVYKTKMENQKHILKNVFLFKDIDHIFDKQIERPEFKTLSKIVFRYTPEDGKWGFFTKNS